MKRAVGAWGWWLAGFLFVLASGLALGSLRAPAPETEGHLRSVSQDPSLRPDRDSTGTLAPGEVTELRLDLAAGHFVDLVVDQHESDLRVELVDPGGATVAWVDRPIGHTGPERLRTVIENPGVHLLVLRASDTTCEGRWSVRVETLRQATAEDRERARAADLLARADALRRDREWESAKVVFLEALELVESLGDVEAQVEVRHRLGSVARFQGDPEAAIRQLDGAIELAEGLAGPFWSLLTHAARGTTYLRMDRTAEARDDYERALQLAKEAGDRRQEASALNHLAQIAQRRGRLQESLDLQRESLAKVLPCDRSDRVRIHANLGALLARSLGQPEAALGHFESALRYFEARGSRGSQATIHNQMGQALLDLGRLEEARGHLETAVSLRRDLDRPCSLAASLAHLARLSHQEGRAEQARFEIDQALAQAPSSEDCPRDFPILQFRAADLQLAEGDFEGAEHRFDEALEIYGRRDDPTRRAQALSGRARALRGQGRLAAARRDSRRAVTEIEGVRASVVRSDQRIAYFATAQEIYGVAIELAMSTGDWRRGFELAEQARARALRDRWQELDRGSGGPSTGSKSEELRDRRTALVAELNGATDRWRRRGFHRSDASPDRDVADEGVLLEARIAWLERRIAEIDGDLRRLDPRRLDPRRLDPRRLDPRHTPWTGHDAAGLDTIQRALDADTTLLSFRLGAESSHLWSLDRRGLAAWDLPPASTLEALASEALESLRRPGSGPWNPGPLCALSDVLLGPVGSGLDRLRLVVVADGILGEVPWGALPEPSGPCADALPLLARHTVVTLPSATLATLFDRAHARPGDRTGPWVTVVADPVFGGGDTRLTASRRASAPGEQPWARLVGTAEEAEAILAQVPGSRGRLLEGFEASRRRFLTAVSGGKETPHSDAQGARILHFATHGVFDADRPLASHLVLAQRDAEGSTLDGRLHAFEIAELDLAAELAVLSVCRSGRGRQVPGEGAIGLARGFLQAGVGRVLVSLWDVDDRSATALMETFYRELFDTGTPDEALRRAQEARWREGCSPAEWAGFQLQGDWRAMAPFEP